MIVTEYTDSEMSAILFFERLEPLRRLEWKSQYEKLLAIEFGTFNAPMNRITGKQMPYPDKLPWMINSWQKGLELLKYVISKNEL